MAKGRQHVDLGKGLGDLFARMDEKNIYDITTLSDWFRGGSYFAELPLDQIVPNPRQPRHALDEDDLSELIASVDGSNILQPVVVREVTLKHFELIMGECRFHTPKMTGKETIPAIVHGIDDNALLRDVPLENLYHTNPSPLEEALAYQQLLGDLNCTKGELSQRIYRSRPQISNTLWLLNLPSTA